MRITIDMPMITATDNAGKIEQVVEYLNKLSQDLNFMCANIDSDNLSKNLLKSIGGAESKAGQSNISNDLSKIKSDVQSVKLEIERLSATDSNLDKKIDNNFVITAQLIGQEAVDRANAISSATGTLRSEYMTADSKVADESQKLSLALYNALDARVSALEKK